MNYCKWTFLLTLVLSGAGAYAQLDKPSLDAFLHRIVKDKANRFEIAYIAPQEGKDVFELDGKGSKIVLRGSNGLSVASALNYYLKNYCHHFITWNGTPSPLPAVLPLVKKKVHSSTPYQYRYYLNYCTFQYSMAWWDWARWQQEIDWMALNGINMPLALTGEEGVWQEVYKAMGFTDQELDRFFSGPAYFSWLWMGNIDAWGGPLPAHWKDTHLQLQKKILAAERAFGMKPVLPAFTGHVPPSFKDRFPAAKVKKTNWDAGFDDVYILDPSDSLFEVVGRKFLEAQTREFGTDHFYSADTFNENVPPTSDSLYLDGMSKKVYASMAGTDPKAVWVMQGWMFHYNAAYWKPTQIQALLKAVPDDHMILLDLYSESHPVWNRTDAYYGKPWIWNMLHNFGGNISLWGRMRHVAEDPSNAFHNPSAGKMVGIGLTPEGIEQNPALYHLMLENVWRDSVVDLRTWLDNYTLQRYGVADRPIRMAWHLLEGSVYSGGLTEGGPESIIQARPTLEPAVDRVNTKLSYGPEVLQGAWTLFVSSAPKLKNSDGYRYDLVDITRQVLANYASVLQQRFATAYKEKDTAGFGKSSRQFLELMDDMDKLLATRSDFLLGKWIKEARSCGATPSEADLYEKNARDLITLWGDKESGLREYSCRQWSGLIKGFYKPRWELFFRRMGAALASRGEMDLKAFDAEVKDWEWQWVNSHDHYSDVASGDAVQVASALYKKYTAMMQEPVASNDGIFPAAPEAKSYIDFDSKGFLIKGKRTFLVSAGLEYARIPHELWRDRLLRLKRAGFNCIEVYTFWNWHEPQEGKFDFGGDRDLGAFLRLTRDLGLYAIVRVGPYYCAEWDNGGYPLWLRFKEGVRVREDNKAFEQYVDRFFDKLLPVVNGLQIHKGGPVILVQLENEHPRGWGTYMPDGYFRHLQQKALSMGLKVPYFFSGLHHASDPAGEGSPVGKGDRITGDPARLDDPARNNPWMSTEFWSVWYNSYGSTEKEANEYARRTWKIIAHGGNGYNYYMAHGGSNFGYTNNDEDAASYDYGAAVGQAGDLRPIYYSFRKAAWFARSMEDILENSEDATEEWKGACRDTVLHITARRSPDGELLFADNPSGESRQLRIDAGGGRMLPEQGSLPVAPGEIMPVIHDVVIAPGIRLDWAPVRLLGISREKNSTTLVVYGETGSPAELYFSSEGRAQAVKTLFRSGDVPDVHIISAGGQTIRVMLVSNTLADRVWFVDNKVIVGPAYAGEVRGASVMAEREWPVRHTIANLPIMDWKIKKWNAPAAAGFEDHGWLAGKQPPQMGADGDGAADAWYRARVNVEEAGNYVLQIEGGDRATVFLDGKPEERVRLRDGEAPLALSKGQHTLAIFTAHDGRDKLAGFSGDMRDVDSKGLTGAVTLVKGASLRREVEGWTFSRDGRSDWKEYTIGEDVFNKQQGTAWFKAVLPEPPAGVTKGQLVFRSVDENATVYLNGRRLARHEGWNIPFKVALDGLDTMKRPLVLTIFIENYSNEGGIDQPVKINFLTQAMGVTDWRMRGGLAGAEAATGADWAAWTKTDASNTLTPCFYHAKFNAPAYGAVGDHIIWRVVTTGLGHGSVWVNGHNLGRYPEKVPAPGLYIPECWMKAGENDLLIFDEDGRSADRVAIVPELAASREIYQYTPSSDVLTYVNPFIGTTTSNVYTRWGNEGGTYPGAVAPWGNIQLTPETKAAGGYDYKDSTIFFFSCYHHMSGYPNGSAGRVKIMPVKRADGGGRPFRHTDETAKPGYYRVRLADDGTVVEATASGRVGVFRLTFPAGVQPKLFVGDTVNAVMKFSRPFVEEKALNDGRLLTFSADTNVLLVYVSVSPVGKASAEKNISREGLTFDEVQERTQSEWRQSLSVAEADDPDEVHKRIFYTALYHSLLLPWVISDVDGQYRGMDGKVHSTQGRNEYGGFSAWDTFRSLHPLLCLLYPDRQRDMVLSMMDIYHQTGNLPSDPMTGNHAVAVIADSWMKGVRGFDSAEAYTAMRRGVIDAPYRQEDMAVYRQTGYIPASWPESVTRTVEYAYDDWVVSKFAGVVTAEGAGYNYRKLFDPASLFVLPQGGEIGNSGYKEGDKWVYSYFVPQAPNDLISLMGGNVEFATRLDSALKRRDIIFDNETVFHVPYLFNYAGAADKTQDWVRTIRDERFADSPGGLPGNDDLGSMSSWYIFSALGFYPVCPGRPLYDIGVPLFRKLVLHLSEGHDLVLRAPAMSPRNKYVRQVKIDGQSFGGLQLPHDKLLKARDIVFEMDTAAVNRVVSGPVFSFEDITVSKKRLRSDELFRIRWRIRGSAMGTRIVRLRVNGRRYAYRNCLVPMGQTIADSMDVRLYAIGKAQLSIEGTRWQQDVEIVGEGARPSEVKEVFVHPLVKAGEAINFSFTVQNTGGMSRTIVTPVKVDDRVVRTEPLWLMPGEVRKAFLTIPALPAGWRELQVDDKKEKFKVYELPEESVLLDLSADGRDRSGFGHNGKVIGVGPLFGKDHYIEVPGSPVLDSMGETMTMMLWVFPTEKGGSLVDIFTKGDNHVLQVGGNRTLTFFAGGWGRGDCTVDLPKDWWGRWHHVAGVCDGAVLKLYIDGVLKGTSKADGRVNLSVANKWTLGRNEEFPGQRVFNGYIDGAKVFTEPLTEEEIMRLYQSSGAPPAPPR